MTKQRPHRHSDPTNGRCLYCGVRLCDPPKPVDPRDARRVLRAAAETINREAAGAPTDE